MAEKTHKIINRLIITKANEITLAKEGQNQMTVLITKEKSDGGTKTMEFNKDRAVETLTAMEFKMAGDEPILKSVEVIAEDKRDAAIAAVYILKQAGTTEQILDLLEVQPIVKEVVREVQVEVEKMVEEKPVIEIPEEIRKELDSIKQERDALADKLSGAECAAFVNALPNLPDKDRAVSILKEVYSNAKGKENVQEFLKTVNGMVETKVAKEKTVVAASTAAVSETSIAKSKDDDRVDFSNVLCLPQVR